MIQDIRQVYCQKRQQQKVEDGILITFMNNSKKLQQFLIIPEFSEIAEQLYLNIKIRQILFAFAQAHVKESMLTYKKLMTTKVDFNTQPKQFVLFEYIKKALIDECEKEKSKDYEENIDIYCVSNQNSYQISQLTTSSLEIQDYNHRTTDVIQNFQKQSEFYKRLGFQSTQPMNDFRASGLLGMITFIYGCNITSNFILNASYSQQLPYSLNEQLLKQEVQNGQYYYPVAVSMIQITYDLVKILQYNEQFQQLLINHFVYECLVILENQVEFGQELDRLYSNSSIELVDYNSNDYNFEPHKYDMFIYPYINKLLQIDQQYDVDQLFNKLQSFSQQLFEEKRNIICLTPVFINEQIISGIHPCCYQSLFLAIIYLTIELNRRLSVYNSNAQYIQYQGEVQILNNDIKKVLLNSKQILHIHDFIKRMREINQ